MNDDGIMVSELSSLDAAYYRSFG